MSSGRFDEARDYAFADQALALRKRAGLTQRELAALLQVSGQSIHAWEGGLSYPGTDHLKELIALYLERGTLMAVREEAEAAALWATVRANAARRLLARFPDHVATIETLADLRIEAQDCPEGIALLQRAMQLDPSNSVFSQALAHARSLQR